MKVSDDMKKIVPFKKDLTFKTNISDIISISLEHSLHLKDDNKISGEFVISGEYKMTDTSAHLDKFSFSLPFDISIDDHYNVDNVTIDIDDFNYEIINNNVLAVKIEVLIDKLEENIKEEPEIIEAKDEDIKEIPKVETPSDRNIENNSVTDIFDTTDDDETYATYRVYIVRDEDTIEGIIKKYNTNKEDLSEYNDLKSLKTGDKLIIPQANEMG